MKKERKKLPVKLLELNTGQLGWLPRNPRQAYLVDKVGNMIGPLTVGTSEAIELTSPELEPRPLWFAGRFQCSFNCKLSAGDRRKLLALFSSQRILHRKLTYKTIRQHCAQRNK